MNGKDLTNNEHKNSFQEKTRNWITICLNTLNEQVIINFMLQDGQNYICKGENA